MNGMRCESCGAPLNFALPRCAYCGSSIPQRFGQAFPVRCPWNGTKVCGVSKAPDGGITREWFRQDGVLLHCVHCHASEPHPVSPEGALIHSPTRMVATGTGAREEFVCPYCLKVSEPHYLRFEDDSTLFIPGNWPFREPMCQECKGKYSAEAKQWEAAWIAAEEAKAKLRAGDQELARAKEGWLARRKAAKAEAQ